MLNGQKAIAQAMGLDGWRRVQTLAEAGAPIRIIGSGKGRRYLATKEALVRWVEHTDTPKG